MQMSARNAFGARYVFDGRSHDRLAQRSPSLRMLLGPSPPGNMRRSIAPSVVGTPAPHAAAPYRASGFVLGSKPEVAPLKSEVRCGLRSGHRQAVAACPFRVDFVGESGMPTAREGWCIF